MNVMCTVHGKEYVIELVVAKRLLNCVYENCDSIYINGEKINVDEISRDEIKKQLHGQIYV